MASQNLANYSPEDVVMILSNDIFGSHVISGTAEGTFISYERSVDRATLVVGSDLSAARVLRRNKSGTVTLTLMQSAESNDVLSMIAQRDEEAHDNSYLFSLTIKDLSGRSVFFAPVAFIGNDRIGRVQPFDKLIGLADPVEARGCCAVVLQAPFRAGGDIGIAAGAKPVGLAHHGQGDLTFDNEQNGLDPFIGFGAVAAAARQHLGDILREGFRKA